MKLTILPHGKTEIEGNNIEEIFQLFAKIEKERVPALMTLHESGEISREEGYTPPETDRLLDFIADAEVRFFQTVTDAGAHEYAMRVLNVARKHADLPYITSLDLPIWDPFQQVCVTPPDSKLLANQPKPAPSTVEGARKAALYGQLYALVSWIKLRLEGDHDTDTTLTMLRKRFEGIEPRVNKAGQAAT